MPRYNGSYIGIDADPNANEASGLWTVREAERLLRADKWPAQPTVPGAPTPVAGDEQVSLTWTAPTGGLTPTDYVVQYSSDGGANWTTFDDGVSTDTSATVTGLTNGTAYIFRIQAINILGEGPFGSASGSVTPEVPPLDTQLLLNFNGANNSTTFTDSSPNGFAVTANGDAKISTAQSKFGGASALFDGTGDYLSVAADPALELSGGDFCIEFWVYPTVLISTRAIIGKGTASTVANCWSIEPGGSGIAFFCSQGSPGGELGVIVSGSLATGEWSHVAVTQESGTARLFINGILASSAALNMASTSGTPLIVGAGWFSPSARGFDGYIDDLRILKGRALYTANFTPPAAELGVI